MKDCLVKISFSQSYTQCVASQHTTSRCSSMGWRTVCFQIPKEAKVQRDLFSRTTCCMLTLNNFVQKLAQYGDRKWRISRARQCWPLPRVKSSRLPTSWSLSLSQDLEIVCKCFNGFDWRGLLSQRQAWKVENAFKPVKPCCPHDWVSALTSHGQCKSLIFAALYTSAIVWLTTRWLEICVASHCT